MRHPPFKFPRHYNACPICGGIKAARANICHICIALSKKPEIPDIVVVEGENCRLIGLSSGKLTIVDESMHDLLYWWNWHAAKSSRGERYYAYTNQYANGKQTRIAMHRFIIGAWSGQDVDHKNRNTLDNRRSNLRLCNSSQNTFNSSLSSRNISGYRGVHRDGRDKKWVATAFWNGKSRHLGVYDILEDAARAYDAFVYAYIPDFAVLNFPDEINR